MSNEEMLEEVIEKLLDGLEWGNEEPEQLEFVLK